MRTTGTWLTVLGVIGAVFAVLMDVSVDAGFGQRVNNIGLISDRQNYLMLAVVGIIVGVILIVADKSPRTPKVAEQAKSEPLAHGVIEKDGLFEWGAQTFATKAEANAYVKQRLADHASKAKSA